MNLRSLNTLLGCDNELPSHPNIVIIANSHPMNNDCSRFSFQYVWSHYIEWFYALSNLSFRCGLIPRSRLLKNQQKLDADFSNYENDLFEIFEILIYRFFTFNCSSKWYNMPVYVQI